jgi:hypothetical protein
VIVRQALFEGVILPGREDEFRAYVAERLVPLWRRLPGIRDLRVLYETDRDEGVPGVVMVMFTAFDDAAALAEALASPVRWESRETTKGLLGMFDGRVRHHVFEVAETL